MRKISKRKGFFLLMVFPEGRKVTLFFLKIKHKSITNFKLFEPLVLFIISMIGVSIADTSGMLDSIFLPFRL